MAATRRPTTCGPTAGTNSAIRPPPRAIGRAPTNCARMNDAAAVCRSAAPARPLAAALFAGHALPARDDLRVLRGLPLGGQEFHRGPGSHCYFAMWRAAARRGGDPDVH